jgi:hypothetical protein
MGQPNRDGCVDGAQSAHGRAAHELDFPSDFYGVYIFDGFHGVLQVFHLFCFHNFSFFFQVLHFFIFILFSF